MYDKRIKLFTAPFQRLLEPEPELQSQEQLPRPSTS